MTNPHHPDNTSPSLWKSKAGIALIMLPVIGAFYIAREHYGHISQILPYLILLLCPLMHVFGHKHGAHAHRGDAAETSTDEKRN